MVKEEVRQSILADPELVLDDKDMIRALLGAKSVQGRNVVDLRTVLIDRLEGKLGQLENTHRDVVAAAYENLAGTHQIHRAVLSIMAPKNFQQFLMAVEMELPRIMALDAIKICVEGKGADMGEALGPQGPTRRTILGMPKGAAEAYCGSMRPAGNGRVLLRRATRAGSLIFLEEGSTIMSEAILELDLGENRLPGLLVFGSRDAQRFSAEQGTDLLSFLGQAFSLTLQKWLA